MGQISVVANQVICRMLAWAIALACIVALCTMCAAPAYADADHNRVASTTEMAAARTLGLEGMVPITGDQVKDGTYHIDADCSSSFFKIVDATLIVENGEMQAVITLRSKSYTLVYMGTGKQAAEAPASDYIPFNEGDLTFTIPVEALDADIDCAAFSKNRKKWYDRKIMFFAATLPEDALLVELPEYGDPIDATGTGTTASRVASGNAQVDGSEAVAVDREDGEYSIEVNMVGGSGRASVSSPTWMIVEDGRAYARLLWSSSYYDYMIVDDVKYLNETTDGSNSTFTIPISVMDEEIVVIGDTTAMGDPVEIEYRLTFYSDTIGPKDWIPQEAAIKVLEIALAIIVVGGILNYVLKKRRKQ